MAGQIRRKTQSQIEENVEGAGGLRVTLARHHADGGDLSDRLEISEAEPGQSSGQQNGPAFMDSPQKRQTGRQQNKGRVEDDRCSVSIVDFSGKRAGKKYSDGVDQEKRRGCRNDIKGSRILTRHLNS